MMDPLYFFFDYKSSLRPIFFLFFCFFQLKQQQQQHIPNRSITAFALHLTTYFNLFVFCFVSFRLLRAANRMWMSHRLFFKSFFLQVIHPTDIFLCKQKISENGAKRCATCSMVISIHHRRV